MNVVHIYACVIFVSDKWLLHVGSVGLVPYHFIIKREIFVYLFYIRKFRVKYTFYFDLMI
jgi:hypothetical protein